MRSASSAPAAGRAPLEELLGALVGEVQSRLHVDDRLAHDAEAEVPGLDDPGVHGSDRDLVHPLPADLGEWERAPVVGELARDRVLAEREVVGRPEAVADERPGIGVPLGGDPEQIVDLTLESRGGVVKRRQRAERGRVGRYRRRGVQEPVLPGGREQIVHFERGPVGSPVGGGHEYELRPEPRAQKPGQRRDGGRTDRAVELAAPHHTHIGHRHRLGQRRGQLVQAGRHRPAISTIRRSSVSSGAGTVSPSTTSAAMHTPSGTRGQALPSPTAVPATGAP